MFILYAASSILATITIEDKDFVDTNINYSIIKASSIKVDDFLYYESLNPDGYLMPGLSTAGFNFQNKDYYQMKDYPTSLGGSLSSLEMISEDDLVAGKMPENPYEIVLDKVVYDKVTEVDSLLKMEGIKNAEQLIGKKVTIPNMNEFTIVGITDLQSPSIYVDRSLMINILYNSSSSDAMEGMYIAEEDGSSTASFADYNLYTEKVTLEKGRLPENDYEVVVNISNKDTMPLNKKIDTAINDTKLTVVGYYNSKEDINHYLVNPNMIKYSLILKSTDITVYSENKQEGIDTFQNAGLHIKDSYLNSKETYKKSIRESMIAALISSGIIIGISLIEIFLMIRSSFLSRIKEVGIYRAIGVKKSDIYKMFAGEIIAITNLASIPGILFASYIINGISGIPYVGNFVMITPLLIIIVIAFVYIFNLFIGLLPVFNTIRKTPAAILARTDLE
jgi:ABC-type antimicrobial peptide transport system permease subunit